jgi:hypothetical protein
MRDVKIVLNRKGVRDLLTSDEVEADLRRRAEAIAARAGAGMEAEVSKGRTRARASIRTATPAAMHEEAVRRTLTSALDAGR